MRLTITAASTALFSTWVFIEELGLLFDAGDGVSATLCQKSRKARHIFISHADRDHVCGLLQLHQLNARDGSPSIYYPKDCGSFPALRDFVGRFDPHVGPATWNGIKPGHSVEVKEGYRVIAHHSEHVVKADAVKALGYTVTHEKRRLKDEFRALPGKEIAERKKKLGEDAITEPVTTNLLGYSGDAPGLDPGDWQGVKMLIHEATFLEPETTKGSHANLPQVIESACRLDLDALILLHFSSRYSRDEIIKAIRQTADSAQPSFPIFAVMPGIVSHDILGQAPVWAR